MSKFLAAVRNAGIPICREVPLFKKSEPSLKQSAWYIWY
ncbi:hypothetical protein FHS39_003486 [Streptomyces olivoverticillatus]|uniref:Uncharacterized protein n=1 Tax=Streptomyces olivoverticillatus TaxID=66427 RepID=A0A7W7LQ70_9ACTN|nr:hypothetical protein [Streptomyces olivoverticillatus]